MAYLQKENGVKKMDIKSKLEQYDDFIIIGAIAVGIVGLFGSLPIELPIVGEYTNYFYILIMAAGGYTYWMFHWGGKATKPSLNIQRRVPLRTMSNPKYKKAIQKQMGETEAPSVSIPDSQPQKGRKPSKKIFDTFKRDQ